MHRRTATQIYNFAVSFGGGRTITEQQYWPLDLDKENKEISFEDYMKEKKANQMPDSHFAEIFKTAFKLENNE